MGCCVSTTSPTRSLIRLRVATRLRDWSGVLAPSTFTPDYQRALKTAAEAFVVDQLPIDRHLLLIADTDSTDAAELNAMSPPALTRHREWNSSLPELSILLLCGLLDLDYAAHAGHALRYLQIVLPLQENAPTQQAPTLLQRDKAVQRIQRTINNICAELERESAHAIPTLGRMQTLYYLATRVHVDGENAFSHVCHLPSICIYQRSRIHVYMRNGTD